jgi:hypothetical protein
MGVSWASAAIGGILCGKFRQVEMKFHDFTFPPAAQCPHPARQRGASQFMSRATSSETATFAAILLTPCFSGVLMADLTP